MMELECTLDVQRDILPFVLGRRDEAVQAAVPDKEVAISVLGQERNGSLLYTWDDLTSIDSSLKEVTHIGLYDGTEKRNECLFVHDCKMSVVSCSVNQECSILAYVVKETKSASLLAGGNGASSNSHTQEEQDVYRAFLAEIQPQRAIYDLNVERSSLLRVQFLWPRLAQGQAEPSAFQARESRLLVFLHRESIGLYRVPIARLNNGNVVMSGQPDAQQVVKHFVWAQWDGPSQRLFVVLQRSRAPNDQEQATFFRCLEFTGQGSQMVFTKMMEMELPPDIKLPSNSSRYSYELPSLQNTVSEKSLNMYVICQPGGSMCICYQQPQKKPAKSSSRRSSKAKLQVNQSSENNVTRTDPQHRPGSLDLGRPNERDNSLSPDDGNPLATTPMTPGSLSSAGPYTPMTPMTPDMDASLDLTSDSLSVGGQPKSSPFQWATASPPHIANSGTPNSTTRRDSELGLNGSKFSGPDISVRPRPSSQFVDVQYLVLVLHHKTTLQCTIPQVHRSIAKRMQLFFAPLNGYIMAYYPGTVLHLLNVNPDVEPCLHLAFEKKDIPWIPLAPSRQGKEAEGDPKSQGKEQVDHRRLLVEHLRTRRLVLSHCLRERTLSKLDYLLFDSSLGRCYQPTILKDKLPAMLVGDGLIPFKLGLLHLALVNLKDITLNKKIIESLAQDPFSLELEALVSEVLCGGAFCQVRLKLDRDVTRFLPFTKVDTSKTVQIETLEGTRLSCFKAVETRYSPKIFLVKKVRRDKRQGGDASSALWEALDRQVRQSQDVVSMATRRLDTRALAGKLRREQEQASQMHRNEEKMPSHPQNIRPSLFKKVAAFSKKALMPSRETKPARYRDVAMGTAVADDDAKASGVDADYERHIKMIVDGLEPLLHPRPTSHTRDRVVSYATEFVSCQLQQAKTLLHLIMAAQGFTNDMEALARIPLDQPASESELNLFYMIERVFSAAQNLCYPLPFGFKHFFTCLGFRCLDRAMFLQYVDQGVLETPEGFMIRLVMELPDNRVDKDLKIKLIERLPKASADRVLLAWDHPTSKLIVAQLYTAACVQEGGDVGQKNLSMAAVTQTKAQKARKKSIEAAIPGYEVEETYFDSIPDFPPLTNFMRFIEGCENSWQVPRKGRIEICEKVDPRFVGRVALQGSVREHGLGLGGMAF